MTLKDVMKIMKYTDNDVSSIFGLPVETVSRMVESYVADPMADLLARAILTTPLEAAENTAVLIATKATINDDCPQACAEVVRCTSIDEGLRVFNQLSLSYKPEKRSRKDRFWEISLWTCDSNWAPQTIVKRIIKEMETKRSPKS